MVLNVNIKQDRLSRLSVPEQGKGSEDNIYEYFPLSTRATRDNLTNKIMPHSLIIPI